MVYCPSKLIFVSFVITMMNVKRKQIIITALKNLLSGETLCCCLKLVYGQRATVELCCTLDVATHERRVRVTQGDSWR